MYEVTIETVFAAAHALLINGDPEPIHGHNWHVVATIQGEDVDQNGLLIDFHPLEDALENIVAPFRNANLNDVPPFDRVNPSAELVAKHIFDQLNRFLQRHPHAQLVSVSTTEAPGCKATYRPTNHQPDR